MPVDSTTFRGRLGNADPGEGSFAITPGSSALAKTIRALYVEGAGTVTFTGLDGASDTWDVPDNFVIPVAMTHVTAATATGLHGVC